MNRLTEDGVWTSADVGERIDRAKRIERPAPVGLAVIQVEEGRCGREHVVRREAVVVVSGDPRTDREC